MGLSSALPKTIRRKCPLCKTGEILLHRHRAYYFGRCMDKACKNRWGLPVKAATRKLKQVA